MLGSSRTIDEEARLVLAYHLLIAIFPLSLFFFCKLVKKRTADMSLADFALAFSLTILSFLSSVFSFFCTISSTTLLFQRLRYTTTRMIPPYKTTSCFAFFFFPFSNLAFPTLPLTSSKCCAYAGILLVSPRLAWSRNIFLQYLLFPLTECLYVPTPMPTLIASC